NSCVGHRLRPGCPALVRVTGPGVAVPSRALRGPVAGQAGWANAVHRERPDLGERLAPELDRLAPAAWLALAAPKPAATARAGLGGGGGDAAVLSHRRPAGGLSLLTLELLKRVGDQPRDLDDGRCPLR